MSSFRKLLQWDFMLCWQNSPPDGVDLIMMKLICSLRLGSIMFHVNQFVFPGIQIEGMAIIHGMVRNREGRLGYGFMSYRVVRVLGTTLTMHYYNLRDFFPCCKSSGAPNTTTTYLWIWEHYHSKHDLIYRSLAPIHTEPIVVNHICVQHGVCAFSRKGAKETMGNKNKSICRRLFYWLFS